jgi:hypothetical protein
MAEQGFAIVAVLDLKKVRRLTLGFDVEVGKAGFGTKGVLAVDTHGAEARGITARMEEPDEIRADILVQEPAQADQLTGIGIGFHRSSLSARRHHW